MENEKLIQKFGKKIARVSVDGKNLIVEVSNGAFFSVQKENHPADVEDIIKNPDQYILVDRGSSLFIELA